MICRVKFLQAEQFILEMTKEVLHNRVVVTVSLSAHTLLDALFFKQILVYLFREFGRPTFAATTTAFNV